MMHRRIILALSLVLLATVSATAQGNLHKDEKRGFQFKPPADWTQIPIAPGQEWIVTKYLSDKEYLDRKSGVSYRPDIQVIVFPDVRSKQKGRKLRLTERGLGFDVRYKNFDEFLKSNTTGFYLEKDENKKINGTNVECRIYKFEKLTVERYGIAWIFEGKDAKFALYTEALLSSNKKLKPLYTKAFKSFKFITRKGSLTSGGTTGDLKAEDLIKDGKEKAKNKKKTPADLEKEREEKFDRQVERVVSSLPKGWSTQKSKNFVAITHVDKKYTKEVLKRCEAVRKWLDKEFKFLKGGKPGRVIVRICKDQAEERAFSQTGGRIRFGRDFEIVTHKTANGDGAWESGWVNRKIVSNWFSDKVPELAWSLPAWFKTGLDTYLESADLKGSKLVMKPGIWEKTEMRELAREDKLEKPRKFLSADWQELSKIDGASYQVGAFMRFLFEGPKAKRKGFLENYLKTVVAVAEEDEAKAEAKRKAEMAKAPKELTEEEQEAEEERRFRERNNKKDDRLKRIFERAFQGWSESKWKKFESSYMSFVG